MAAEYIAAQFRGAGLEPAGDDGYFQTAKFIFREPNPEGAALSVRGVSDVIRAAPAQLAASCGDSVDVPDTKVVKSNLGDIGKLEASAVKDRVLILEPDTHDTLNIKLVRLLRRDGEEFDTIRTLAPVLVAVLIPEEDMLREVRKPRLLGVENLPPSDPPLIAIWDQGIQRQVESDGSLTASAKCQKHQDRPVPLRNVVGLLRGSDTSLSQTAIVLSAHYDHVGVRPDSEEEDTIYNGANDNASGAAAIIEIAAVLSALPTKPKRSIVVAAFFGEEQGMLGSKYYVRHPVFPLEKTVAGINLEQVGRPWPVDVSKPFKASVTGFEYSDVVRSLQRAASLTGVELQRDERNDDDFFRLSDNISFAEKGVPAHTVCTAFLFPDYHKPGDHWDKLDYDNMAVITRMIALGTLIVADSTDSPMWREENPRTEKYRKAIRQ